ncbi:LOW QUALITY PROTEIN: uncharacterized protein WM277_011945 [Molossus nigricans]
MDSKHSHSVKLRDGHFMPMLGFGILASEGVPKSKAAEATKMAIDVGFRHIDATYVYENEEEVGKAIREKIADGTVKREDIFYTTKLSATFFRPELVRPALERSLKKLQLDYVDLFIIHVPLAMKPGEELLPKDANGKVILETVDLRDTEALEKYKDAGLTKSIGVSSFNYKLLEMILNKPGLKYKPVCNQVCHPYLNQSKLLEFCKSKDIVLVAYSALGSQRDPNWSLVANSKMEEALKTAIDVGYRHIDSAYFYLNEEEIGRAIQNKIANGIVANSKMEEALKTAIDVGYRHIDSAYFYLNEEEIGRAIQNKIANGIVANSKMEEALKTAIDVGYRHIDSAYFYLNEEEIGRAIQNKIANGIVKRENIFYTSKVFFRQFSVNLNDGHFMPVLGLGTSAPSKVANSKMEEALKTAIDVGYRHIDSAYFYLNEEEIGRAIQNKIANGIVKRENIFYTSKLWGTFLQPELVQIGLEISLRKLLSYVDLFLIHFPAALKPGEEIFPKDTDGKTIFDTVDICATWEALEKCEEAGLAKFIGVSNFNSKQLQKIQNKPELKYKPVCNQVECHLYLNQSNFCKSKDIVLTVYAALGSDPGKEWMNKNYPVILKDPVINAIALRTPAQVALRYQLQRGVVVLAKSFTEKRIRENFQVFDFQLTSQDMERLDGLNRNLLYFKVTAEGSRRQLLSCLQGLLLTVFPTHTNQAFALHFGNTLIKVNHSLVFAETRSESHSLGFTQWPLSSRQGFLSLPSSWLPCSPPPLAPAPSQDLKPQVLLFILTS